MNHETATSPPPFSPQIKDTNGIKEIMSERHRACFWSKVTIPSMAGCWEWRGSKNNDQYGIFGIWIGSKQKTCLAHRVSYELLSGSISEGLTIDHLCRNRGCCNPTHLEPVSIAINILRGEGYAARNARKTHCARGHEFSPNNTLYNKKGHRTCRACNREKCRDYKTRMTKRASDLSMEVLI